MRKFNFNALAKALERLDGSGDGMEGRCGNWEFRLGGYDHGYGIYFKGEEIGRVNYELHQYEIYHDDFIPREQIPEFLAAIDAWKFKDVGEHGDDVYGEEVDIGWDLEARRDDALQRSH